MLSCAVGSSLSYPLSVFQNAYSTEPIHRAPDWDRLVETLTRHKLTREQDKRRLMAWSPATFEGTRKAENARDLSCLVLDYDDGTTIQEALKVWQAWRGLGYSSISHSEDAHRFRVVLPLANVIAATHWRELWKWAHRRSSARIDAKCCNADRIYFLPYTREGSPVWAAAWDGPALDLEAEYKANPPPQKKRKPRPQRRYFGDQEHRAKQRLKHDPQARDALGDFLNASNTGGMVRRVECPSCGRRAVWYVVDPERKSSAECNHRNSCGWSGPLWALL
mgnify:CR=1 FL=1